MMRSASEMADPTMIQQKNGMLIEDSSSEEALEASSSSIEDIRSSSHGEGAGATHSSDSSAVVIAKDESKAVLRSKVIVYVVLCFMAIATAMGTWYYVRQDETSDFEGEFDVFADDLIESAEDKAVTVFRQLHTLSTAITSHALDANQTWPYVTLPHFATRTKELGELSGSSLILFAPLVEIDDRSKWDKYLHDHEEEIFIDTFGGKSENIKPIHDLQLISEEVIRGTNLTLLHEDFYLPVMQYGPKANDSGLINLDMNSHPVIQRVVRDSVLVKHTMLSEVTNLTFFLGFTGHKEDFTSPRSIIVEPVFNSFDEKTRSVVGFVMAAEPWNAYFEGNLPKEVHGFVVDVHDSCGSDMTFVIDSGNVIFDGFGDKHDPKYNYLAHQSEFATFARYDGEEDGARHCDYSLIVYPSKQFEDDYHSSKPFLYSAVLVGVFVATVATFVIYDWMVRRRQDKVMGTAQRTTALVHSLFPREVGDRLIAEAEQKADKRINRKEEKLRAFTAGGEKMGNDDATDLFESEPIADFFTATTIMFADIVGFTAWSSSREPKQVFSLLETIYHDFDVTAARRRVFKVETVGDCYVAVCGLPTPRSDHAVVMARFARDCLYRFQALSHQLEVTLGPDTADLSIRVGLHSGPVTAGVLRGERSRFQLFGDTMNTASRMESTSRPHKIQISQDTADLLTQANKNHWCRKRDDLVDAKGKGMMQTYWLDVRTGERSSSSGENSKKDTTTTDSDRDDGVRLLTTTKNTVGTLLIDENLKLRQERLVKWNVEILTKILVQVQERRQMAGTKPDSPSKIRQLEQGVLRQGGMVLDEVVDIIRLPSCDEYATKNKQEKVELSEKVKEQLLDYVSCVASMYQNNPFHNFEHASHVTMSVVKLLSRIVAPDIKADDSENEQTLHDHTYGITSDPMTQFACAFCAIIHDVDHNGVPNTQLVREQTAAALAYKGKSVAEQNSVSLAWSLLMEPEYLDLRRAIYSTQAEFKRFRQLVVNSVMATDIMDKDLGVQRKERWVKAFSESATEEKSMDVVNRKATIVLEHLIQASDVSHTMQHWQVYLKWNKRLFFELFKAYKLGRSDKDPSEFWFKGEVGFLEHYVIPLANKLKDCGVFGVSSDEYLNYALRNKREWVARGQQVVEEFKEDALVELAELFGEKEEDHATTGSDFEDEPEEDRLLSVIEEVSQNEA